MIKLHIHITSASHLDAMQGASEERPKAYSRYGEDVPQLSNAATRQELAVHPPVADGRVSVRRAG